MHFRRPHPVAPSDGVAALGRRPRPAGGSARGGLRERSPCAFLSGRAAARTCLALLVAVAAISTIALLVAGLALRGAADLLAQAGVAGDALAAGPSWTVLRLLKAGGACGAIAGLFACGRFLLDLRRQGWL